MLEDVSRVGNNTTVHTVFVHLASVVGIVVVLLCVFVCLQLLLDFVCICLFLLAFFFFSFLVCVCVCVCLFSSMFMLSRFPVV